MPLSMIFGTAGTGKSTYCISRMKALHANEKKSVMIVPEQFAHAAETRLIKDIGYLSDDIQATSFKRLAQKTLRKNGLLKNSVSSVGKSMLLAKSILKNARSLSVFKSAAKKPGFIDSMLSFIAECKRSEIHPEALVCTSDADPLLAAKIHDLSLIYASYQTELQADYTDAEEYVSLLTSFILKDGTFSDYSFFIDEFFRFTPAELACICALAASGASVHVALGAASENAHGVFEPVALTARRLTAMAKEAGIPVLPSVYLENKYRFTTSKELAHFESEYNHYPPILYKEETHDITLYIAGDIYTETQVVASAIRRAVTEEGLRYRDISVLSGNPELYEDLIKTVFPVYQIPVFIDRKRSLLSHSIIVMLLSLFELMARGLETETLLSYIKCGYCGLTPDESDRLENFALAGRLRHKDWLDDKRFLRQAESVFAVGEDYEETHTEEAQELLNIRNKVLTPLLSLRSKLAQSRLVADRASAFFDFFEEISLAEQVQAEMETLRTQGAQQEAREHAEIYNIIINLLNELVTCLGEEKIGLRRLTEIVSAGLSQCEIATIPPSADHVFLGDVSRSLNKNVKRLFVIGAVDGTFPPVAAPDCLLKDSERHRLKEQGLELGPDSKTMTFHNQYVMYSALNIGTEKMYISYPVADMEGKGLRPAALVTRLKKIFPKLSISENITVPPSATRLIAGKESAWQYVLEHFYDATQEVTYLKNYFAHDAAFADRYQTVLQYGQYSKQPGKLSPDIIHRLYGKTLRGSVTQLETFGNCPFSYFLRYGLRAKERKILKIEAPDVGSLMHRIVELASQRIVRDGQSFAALSEEYLTKLAEEIVNELFTGIFIENLYGENRLKALIKRLKRQTVKMLSIIGTHVEKGDFEPCAFEVAFSENGELAPVTVDLPNGDSVVLTGRIDRIDRLQQNASVYIKIIDYKTGNKNFRLSDVYNGLSLQLAVYLIAATEGTDDNNLMPAGMFYFRLVDKTVNATASDTEEAMLKQFKMSGLVLKDTDIIQAMDRGISGHSTILHARINKDGRISEHDGCYATMNQFRRLKKYVYKTVSEIGQEIMSGNTAVYPCKGKEGLPCRYCRYHPVCAFSAERDPHKFSPQLSDEAVWNALENEEP